MLLFLDTSNPESTKIALVSKDRVVDFVAEGFSLPQYGGLKTSTTLSSPLVLVQKILKKHRLKFSDFKKVAVVVGPGPFTRVRTGVVIANALAYGLGIRIVPVKSSRLPKDLAKLLAAKGLDVVKPVYDKRPNISKPKRKQYKQ